MTAPLGPSEQPLPCGPLVTPRTTRIERKGMGGRTQMKPVAARATFWLTESFSAGRARSFRPAATRPHLAIGAQKKMVLIRVSGWPISVTSHYVAVIGLCYARPTGSVVHMPRIQEHIISVCGSTLPLLPVRLSSQEQEHETTAVCPSVSVGNICFPFIHRRLTLSFSPRLLRVYIVEGSFATAGTGLRTPNSLGPGGVVHERLEAGRAGSCGGTRHLW